MFAATDMHDLVLAPFLAAAFLLNARAPGPGESSPSPSPRKPTGYLVLSEGDRKNERSDVTVWDSFLSKARCAQAIKDAKREDATPPDHKTCIHGDCVETRCYGKDCYIDEADPGHKNLKYCNEGRVHVAIGTYVKVYPEGEQCGETMVRVMLTGEWKGHEACADPDNVSEKPPASPSATPKPSFEKSPP
jgi:hypothetical protein